MWTVGNVIRTELSETRQGAEKSQDELAVMDGGKCILQVRGVRPFFSDKYDITRHRHYPIRLDDNPKNEFDIAKFVQKKKERRMSMNPKQRSLR